MGVGTLQGHEGPPHCPPPSTASFTLPPAEPEQLPPPTPPPPILVTEGDYEEGYEPPNYDDCE